MLDMSPRPLPPRMHAINESLAFLVELAMIAGLAWWGATVHGGAAVRILLAVAAPVAAAVVVGLIAFLSACIAAVDREALGGAGRTYGGA